MKDNLGFPIHPMKELMGDIHNVYGMDNWDSDRFGELKRSLRSRIIFAVRSFLLDRGIAVFPRDMGRQFDRLEMIGDMVDGLSWLYNLLEDEYSKTTLVKVIAYRILGHTKVKLPVNTPDYWRKKNMVLDLIQNDDTIEVNFMNWSLNWFELEGIGVPVNLYFTTNGVLKVFVLKQYEYGKGESSIKSQPGDYVIDAGGCWGDTALYFAHEVGENGRVYSFEFMPSNMEVMRTNLNSNPRLTDRIETIEHPLWSDSDTLMFCHDQGPGSQVSNQKVSQGDFQVSTLSIDDFVRRYEVPRVDFIKMDVEGAELAALKGAMETIKTHRPRLAISVYHSLGDFVDIPSYLSSLGVGYRFYLDHSSISSEETVLFAVPEVS